MNYQYTYLIMDLLFLLVWIILFLIRKDVRKEMLFMSILLGLIGIPLELVYLKDWWHPLTITNTAIGIEDFLFSFSVGGIALVIYEEVFKKKIKIRNVGRKKELKRNLNFLFLFLLWLFLFLGSFYLLHFNSFVSSVIAYLACIFTVYLKRKDLIIDSLFSGALLLILVSLVYTIVNFITPGWIGEFWLFKNVPNVILFNIPIDDIIWYFLSGALLGIVYEFWQEGRLIDKK